MKETKIPVSVILPVYNGGHYLLLSVHSVLEQSFESFELLILDDCSTDESRNYISSLKDARVTVFKNNKNKGLFYNLNFLIRKSKSELIKLWSQDDIMEPHCLETTVAFHQKHPGIGFSYSGRHIIDAEGAVKRIDQADNTPEIISPSLHALIAFYTGSIAGNIANVCLNRSAVNEVGLFREDMRISADFDMWVRLARDYNTGFIKDKLIKLRDHNGQLSRNENFLINHVREDLEIYRSMLQYVDEPTKKRGALMLRRHKLVFYYTLMIKTLLNGKVKGFYAYFKELSSFDNFYMLTFFFVRAKLTKPGKPNFSL